MYSILVLHCLVCTVNLKEWLGTRSGIWVHLHIPLSVQWKAPEGGSGSRESCVVCMHVCVCVYMYVCVCQRVMNSSRNFSCCTPGPQVVGRACCFLSSSCAVWAPAALPGCCRNSSTGTVMTQPLGRPEGKWAEGWWRCFLLSNQWPLVQST